MALFTVDELKTYLGLSGTGDDAYLAQLVSGVNSSVLKYLRRSIEAAEDTTEYHSGNGRNRLYLKNRPITAITGVWVDHKGYFGQAPDAFDVVDTLLVQGVDYVVESTSQDEANQSCLIKLSAAFEGGGSVWGSGIGNIKVTYDHGYASVPADLKLACFMICAAVRSARKAGLQYSSESLGSYSYSLMAGSTNNDAVTATGMLKSYRGISI